MRFMFPTTFWQPVLLARRSLYINDTLDLPQSLHNACKFFPALRAERYIDCCNSLLACFGVNRINIDLTLCKYLCDIHEKTGSVIAVDLDLCTVQATAAGLFIMLPLGIDQTLSISDRLIMLIQSVLWMETPRPLVTNPTISSPGTGLQHFEKCTATS